MTPKEYLLISWMSYLDLPALYVHLLKRGGKVPLAAFADSVLRMDKAGELRCVKLYAAAREAAREMLKLPGFIVDYVNFNTGNGLVAYVIQTPEETVVAFRGSERAGECVSSNIDWVDNVCERSAAAGGGKLIVKKTARRGVTVAVAETAWEVNFE